VVLYVFEIPEIVGTKVVGTSKTHHEWQRAFMLTRDLQPSERLLFRDHLLRLSQDDRISRFAGMRSDKGIDDYVAQIDFMRDHIKVAFDERLNVIAAIHLVMVDPESAEFALSIEQAYRGKGYGRALFKSAIRWMQNRGVKKAYSLCMRSNGPMLHIAETEGMQLHFDGSEVEAFLDLDQTSFSDFWQEMAEEQGAWLDFTGKFLTSPFGYDYLANHDKEPV